MPDSSQDGGGEVAAYVSALPSHSDRHVLYLLWPCMSVEHNVMVTED